MPKTIRPGTDVSRRWLLSAAIKSTTASCALGAAGVFAYKTLETSPPRTADPHDDVTVIVNNDMPEPVTAHPAVSGFQMGYNMPGPNYYTPVVMLNNWGKNVRIDDNGNLYIPPSGIDGAVSVKTNPGVTLKRIDTSISPILSNPKLGIHTFIVIKDTSETTRLVGWTGTKPTSFEVTRYGASGTIAREWISGVMGKWLRNLDMDQVNDVPIVAPPELRASPNVQFYRDTPTGSIVPYQDMADAIFAVKASRADFVGLWDVLRVDLSDQDVTDRATYQRDHIQDSVVIALEFGNEMFWNYAFSGNVRAMIDGVRRGYYGDATETKTNPPINIDLSYDVYSGQPAPPVGRGQLIAIKNLPGEGPCVLKAMKDVPAGTDIRDGTAFTKEYGYGLLMEAGKRWSAVRHNQIIEIYRSVFGEDRFQRQIIPVIMGQQDRGEITDWMSTQKTFVSGYWQKIKGVGCSFYINDSGAADKSPTAIGTAFRKNIKPTIAKIKNIVDQANAMGKLFMAYEGMTHPSSGDYNSDPAYRSAWDSFFNSTDGETFMADWAYTIRTTATGPVCGYMGVGPKPWSLKERWSDTKNPRLIGWNRGLDPSYSPTKGYAP